MICKYTSTTYLLQNMGEITVYEALLEGVAAYAEHVTIFML